MERTDRYWVRDTDLASDGMKRIAWAEQRMPVVGAIRRRFERERPLKGVRVAACLHVTKETAALVRTLVSGGAEVSLCASNPLSTQDDVAAALVEEGVSVYAYRGMSESEYYECIGRALSIRPEITVDDGADLTVTVHKLAHRVQSPELSHVLTGMGDVQLAPEDIRGGTEETTTGVTRLRALEREGRLLYPIIAVNDSPTKSLFDNPLGTGQSTIDAIMRSTGVLLAGKRFVVFGYGRVGSGIAARARGMGAEVIVVEVNPVRALMAAMEGYRVMGSKDAAKTGDIFVTATGNIGVIRREHMELMKDGAILANAGHYDVEVSLGDLRSLAESVEEISPSVERFRTKDGRNIYLLAKGRLVNLVAAEGHPSEVMDLSFSLQALSVELLARERERLPSRVLDVPPEVDRAVAELKLDSMGITIDEMTEEQLRYVNEWKLGTS
ncbi:MAG: adenosylhomocysteinase [Thaumarchaeota archaeon]|nr:adenosylhomocysteinase [Candidatus Calditenuaceae archaeon]MDW8042042.1 adenosylhomocysteinase [Nitrososphaerota archaeon]